MSTTAHDMSEHWRLISAEGQNDDYRVYGTWWVSADNVKPIDVCIWNKHAQFGRVYYSGDMTAFIRDGEIDLPKHMIRPAEKLAEAEDAWELLLEVIAAAAAAFRPQEADHA